jgi:hypothetical protein
MAGGVYCIDVTNVTISEFPVMLHDCSQFPIYIHTIKRYNILFVTGALYGCETRHVIAREQHRLRVFDDRAQRIVF